MNDPVDAKPIHNAADRGNDVEHLEQLNQTLQTINAANEVLVRSHSEKQLVDNICRIIVNQVGFRFAWIGLVDDEQTRHLQTLAYYADTNEQIDSVSIRLNAEAISLWPGKRALRTGKFEVMQNPSKADCYLQLCKDRDRPCDCVKIAALPLNSDGHTLGVMLIYANLPKIFDEEQLNLLQRLADNLAYGIQALRNKASQEKLQLQLQQSQKLEALGQLTGGIAHDFNNILAAILGYTELMQDYYQQQNEEEKIKGYLDKIQQAGERARDLVLQMLAYSRHDSLKPEPVLLGPLMENGIQLLHAILPSSIVIETAKDTDNFAVMMDALQFQQVLLNLCINARDAMNGQGTLRIELSHVNILNQECASCHSVMQGRYEKLSVRDTGTGIERDKLNRIFDPYFSTKVVGDGSGMGLSMVHGIVHGCGGHIFIETENGKGTCISLLFPVVKG